MGIILLPYTLVAFFTRNTVSTRNYIIEYQLIFKIKSSEKLVYLVSGCVNCVSYITRARYRYIFSIQHTLTDFKDEYSVISSCTSDL